MKKSFLLLLFSVTINFSLIFPQVADSSDQIIDKTFSRIKFSSGYNRYELNSYLLFNLSYHYSAIKLNDYNFGVNLFFEPGLNFLFAKTPKDFDEPLIQSMFLIYLELGPEIRLNKNLFLNVNAGGNFYLYNEGIDVVPYVGIEAIYLFFINSELAIELNAGFNKSLFTNKPYDSFFIGLGLIYF